MDDMSRSFIAMQQEILNMQGELGAEMAETDKANKGSPLINAIRKGQMNETSPIKCINAQASDSFKVWAKSMKELIFWHDERAKTRRVSRTGLDG